jgi:hypothetical protein
MEEGGRETGDKGGKGSGVWNREERRMEEGGKEMGE